jgi:hypothetical protein
LENASAPTTARGEVWMVPSVATDTLYREPFSTRIVSV